MLNTLIDNFEQVMEEGTKPQKKHLIQRLVKKVVVHNKQKVEVWYGLPNTQRFADWNTRLPASNPLHNHSLFWR